MPFALTVFSVFCFFVLNSRTISHSGHTIDCSCRTIVDSVVLLFYFITFQCFAYHCVPLANKVIFNG